MRILTLALEAELLKIRSDGDILRVDRGLSEESDFNRFKQWSHSYGVALERGSDPHTLLQIGREMHGWLDGGERCLERVLDRVESPLLVEFCASTSDPRARDFLDAPWELVADAIGHWAERTSLVYCPVRRLGRRGTEAPPSMVFIRVAVPRIFQDLSLFLLALQATPWPYATAGSIARRR